RYTHPHGQIAVIARREGANVEISVRDNGLGMSSQALPNVFEMFYQAGNGAETSVNAGLGIGLTLAKRLVEMHSGTIRAESPGPNKGSTFTVRLPLSQRDATDAPEAAADDTWLDKRRVLIVDDNADAAETLRMLMTTLGGKEVQTASNGPDALRVAAQLQPDV